VVSCVSRIDVGGTLFARRCPGGGIEECGGGVPYVGKHFSLLEEQGFVGGRGSRKGGQRAFVHLLHLATSRPGRRWLVRRVYVMWGRVFDDALATRDVLHA
jgi:hypothetical protein